MIPIRLFALIRWSSKTIISSIFPVLFSMLSKNSNARLSTGRLLILFQWFPFFTLNPENANYRRSKVQFIHNNFTM